MAIIKQRQATLVGFVLAFIVLLLGSFNGGRIGRTISAPTTSQDYQPIDSSSLQRKVPIPFGDSFDYRTTAISERDTDASVWNHAYDTGSMLYCLLPQSIDETDAARGPSSQIPRTGYNSIAANGYIMITDESPITEDAIESTYQYLNINNDDDYFVALNQIKQVTIDGESYEVTSTQIIIIYVFKLYFSNYWLTGIGKFWLLSHQIQLSSRGHSCQ